MTQPRCNRHQHFAELPQLCGICQRIDVEHKIAEYLVNALIHDGYFVSVNDTEETTLERSTSVEEILSHMFTTDIDNLLIHNRHDAYMGFVQLVYGNSGWDVISDYSTYLESTLGRVCEWAEQFEV